MQFKKNIMKFDDGEIFLNVLYTVVVLTIG